MVRPRFDFVTLVEEWVWIGVRQKFVARFMTWRQHSTWAQKSNGMEATAECVLVEQTAELREVDWRETTFLIH